MQSAPNFESSKPKHNQGDIGEDNPKPELMSLVGVVTHLNHSLKREKSIKPNRR